MIRAAGGVLWRPAGGGSATGDTRGGVEVALVHRPRYDDWSLPKGKAKPGEHLLHCGLREVREETGQDAVVQRPLGSSRYAVLTRTGPAPKVVHWWAMRARGGTFTASREVDQVRWLDPTAALRLLDRDRAPLRRFLAGGVPARTVLLVYPARTSAGPDPALSPAGHRQAARLAELLSVYGPRLVSSAAPAACLDTVRPLAVAVRRPVAVDAAWDAAEHAVSATPARTRLEALSAGGDPLVVCAERAVVADLAASLLGRPARPAGPGSTVVISTGHRGARTVEVWAVRDGPVRPGPCPGAPASR